MKSKILAPVFTVLLLLATPVSAASWTAAVAAALNSGDMTQIDIIAAENPTQQGDIAMFLLQQAKAKMTSNPALAAKIFAAAAAYVPQIPSANVCGNASAVQIIKDVLSSVSSASFQSGQVEAAGSVIAAAVQMSTAPNVATCAGDLNELALAAADQFLTNNPQAPLKVKQLVSLAQTQGGGAPTVGVQGAGVPSGE